MGRIADRIAQLLVTCDRCGNRMASAQLPLHKQQQCLHESWNWRLDPKFLDAPKHLRVA